MAGQLGRFVDGRREHYLAAYRAGMAELPAFDAESDVSTSYGTVHTYHFAAQHDSTPVVLLPGRNAATPMWCANLAGLTARRSVYCLDLLGEAGLSVQTRPITDAHDQARWLEETLAGLGLQRVHLMGVSIGGWAAANHAVRFPDRVASLALLEPVFTFAPIPLRTLAASALLTLPGVPVRLRRWFLSWLSGGVDLEVALPEARLIDAAMTDFALRLPAPSRITDDQLRSLTMPVLAFLGGRSVMLDARKAARHARDTVPAVQVEVFPEASHAVNGEFAEEIERQVLPFWDAADPLNSGM
ncbi:alpha/beta fold hydrolase [Mycobacterium sp. SMC-4]|uniref:alpha/beta fold hydrolase n=1 Tax=Mycobacterium sp. SMC-4 TaxID=2857059 RepID=UPI003D01346E